MNYEVVSFYMPNVLGNGMTSTEYNSWHQWMRDMETITTDPEQMLEIDRSQAHILKNVCRQLARAALAATEGEKR